MRQLRHADLQQHSCPCVIESSAEDWKKVVKARPDNSPLPNIMDTRAISRVDRGFQLHRYDILGATRVLIQDPCPHGLPVMLTVLRCCLAWHGASACRLFSARARVCVCVRALGTFVPCDIAAECSGVDFAWRSSLNGCNSGPYTILPIWFSA